MFRKNTFGYFLFFLIKNSFACEIKARVSVVGNEFPAIPTVGAGAKKCKGAEVKTNLTADHQKINVAGMSSEPAEYTSAIVANTSIVALLNNDLIRPLDDLVKKHGSKLKKNQIVKSTRGIQGGYILSKKPNEIKLTNILNFSVFFNLEF
mgnify:CR=1 FL=1